MHGRQPVRLWLLLGPQSPRVSTRLCCAILVTIIVVIVTSVAVIILINKVMPVYVVECC